MKLQHVVIENFRSFYGEQFINFSTDEKKNTTIIYAPNGYGKTNFLNAISWCFHERFTESFNKADDLLNWEAKKKNRKSYQVEVGFEHDGKSYRIKRSGGSQVSFKLWRITDGNHEEITSGVDAFVNSVFPVDMAGYFISDGEGELQIDKRAQLPIGRSVRDILGFKVAEKTLDDIAKLRKEIVAELDKVDVDERVVEIERDLAQCQQDLRQKTDDLQREKDVLERYEAEYERVEEDLRAIDLNEIKRLTDERALMDRSLTRLKVQRKEFYGARIRLIQKYSWVAFAQKFKDEALSFIDDAELKGKLPAPFNVQLVKDILEQSECICGAPIHEGSEALINIRSLLDEASNPQIINRVHRARSRLTLIQDHSQDALMQIQKNVKDRKEVESQIASAEAKLEDLSIKIKRVDDSRARNLEGERTTLKKKVNVANKRVLTLEYQRDELTGKDKALKEESKRLAVLSPQARRFVLKKELLEHTERMIAEELETTEASIFDSLRTKIDKFLSKYLRQDYSVEISTDLKICLVDRNGNVVPTSKGQSAILSFIYISSLVALAREFTSKKNAILLPGAIAPLVYDAPFSNLDPAYALDVARELPNLVDQLIILMYQDPGKDVAGALQKTGRLGRVYYLNAHIASEQGDRPLQSVEVDNKEYIVTNYGAERDRVEICEATSYVS